VTRYLPALRLSVVAAILIVATAGGVFSQTSTAPSTPELEPTIKLVREGRSNEALKELKKAIEINKQSAEAWYYLGVVYLQLNDFKKAASAFQSLIRLQPSFAADAHAGYAYALLRRGKLSDAAREARIAISVDSKNFEAIYTLAIVNLRTGNRDEALKNAETLIALKPNFADAYLIKSQAIVRFNGDAISLKSDEDKKDRLNRYRAAAEAIEQYLKLAKNPEDAQLWKDQLESLKFYVANKTGTPDQIYSGKDVTTKARLISKPEPVYPQKARQELVTGRVVLRCVFAADGKVKHILVVESLPFGLTEVSIAAARAIKFVPATVDGKPVSMFMQLEYNFNLY